MGIVNLTAESDALLTSGRLAELSGFSRDRIIYCARRLGVRGRRAGNVFVFDAAQAEEILHDAARVEAIKLSGEGA